MNKSRMIHLERFSSSFDLSYDAIFADLPDFDLVRLGIVLGSWNSHNFAGTGINDTSAVSFLDDPAAAPPTPLFLTAPLGGNPLPHLPSVPSRSETNKFAETDGEISLPHPSKVASEMRGQKDDDLSTPAVADDQVSMRLVGGRGRKQRGREEMGQPETSPRTETGVVISKEEQESVAEPEVGNCTRGTCVSPGVTAPDTEREGSGGQPAPSRLPPLLASSTGGGTSSEEEEGKRGRSASTEALTKRGGTMRKKKMKGRGAGEGLLRGVSIPEGGRGEEDWAGAVAELFGAVDERYGVEMVSTA